MVRAIVIVLGCAAVSSLALAQPCEPRWSDEFRSSFGVSGQETCAATLYDDGSGETVYLATGGGLARWNGAGWDHFAVTGLDTARVLSVFDEDGDGPARPELFVGGYGGSIDGVAMPGLLKWNGTRWAAVHASIGIPMAFAHRDEPQGPAIYMATIVPPREQVQVGRWDGETWTTLGLPFTSLVYTWDQLAVGDLEWHDDGTGPALYAAGYFNAIGGTPVRSIARWDGSAWSEVGGGLLRDGVPAYVQGLTSFDDGGGPALYAAGRFTAAGGVTVRNVARWKDGAWSAMGAGLSHPVSSTARVYGIAPFDDGTGPALYACGGFAATSVGNSGGPEGQVAKWTGGEWVAIEHDSAHRSVLGLIPTPSSLIVWGGFGRMNHTVTERLAAYRDREWHRFARGFDGAVRAFAVHDDGSGPALYAGGEFSLAIDVDAPGIASWDGQRWFPVPGIRGTLNALNSFPDPVTGRARLYAGGQLTLIGVGPVAAAVWDGQAWASAGSDSLRTINDMTVFDDGTGGGPTLFAAGRAQGSQSVVAKYDAGVWKHIGTLYGSGNAILALKAYTDDDGPALFIGGTFQYVAGSPPIQARNVARWDAARGWSEVGGGVDHWVRALAVYPGVNGPALHAGGSFDSAGGLSGLNGLVKWDGKEWSRVGGGITGFVNGMASVLEHGREVLYIGGKSLDSAGGVPVDGVARWDGSAFTGLTGGVGAGPTAFISHDDGAGPSIFMGGEFRVAGGLRSEHIARWFLCDGCYANCDGSTAAPVLSVGDFACFLNAFAAGSPYANCDGSSVVPALNVRDFQCFLNRFAEACP